MPEGFDPLAAYIERARAEGIEVHAWVNTYTAGRPGREGVDPRHVLRRHPEWVTYDSDGKSLLAYTGQEPLAASVEAAYLDPGLPEVQDFVYGVFMEIVEKYEVDGIHFDYVRYPGRDFGYHPRVRSRFADEFGIDPLALASDPNGVVREHGQQRYALWVTQWDQFRRDRVTGLVRRIYHDAKAVRPDIKVSAAVFANSADAFANRLQDWQVWLREGVLDVVLPMAYSTDPAAVRSRIADAVRAAQGWRSCARRPSRRRPPSPPWTGCPSPPGSSRSRRALTPHSGMLY